MKAEELKNVVTQFTKGILGKYTNFGMCFAVCSPLATYLQMCGVGVDLVRGEIYINGDTYEHYWLKQPNGDIIDPTASQFNQIGGYNMPDIYLGAKPDYYKLTSSELPINL